MILKKFPSNKIYLKCNISATGKYLIEGFVIDSKINVYKVCPRQGGYEIKCLNLIKSWLNDATTCNGVVFSLFLNANST